MKSLTLIFALMLAAAPFGKIALAQRHKLSTVNAETPEGQLLQQIGQESDEARKLTLMEQFTSQYPKHEAIGWVWGQMQTAYVKANQMDKALDIGAKLIALDAEDLDAAHQNLKASEAKKDPDLILKWAGQTSAIALKTAQSPQPKEEDEVENWKRRVDFARQLNTYTEYSLYAAALQTTDPRKRIELAGALEQRNAKSEYMSKMLPLRFTSYQQLGDNDKTLAFAEKTLATDQGNADMLAFTADQYFQKKREPEKVIAYSAKIVELMETQPKPEGVTEAEWAKKKQGLTGLAHFMTGGTHFNQNKFAPADKSLRAALPLVEGNVQLKAATLFFLALANHKLNNLPDAIKFSQQCAAIKGPFQAKALENVKVMRQQSPASKKK